MTYTYDETDFLIEPSIKQVTVNGKELDPTPSEYSILSAFLKNPRHLFTKKEIDKDILDLPYIEGESYTGKHSCYSHISKLKHVLEDSKDGLSSNLVTKKGRGWYWKG
ncbi:MAG: winged helix-turn-helix domain-containing protein [Gammaproteobacteria bacterium]|nr:winged helix-turn-helix domain-containing protein [Gammaproteobacteria bacterium]